MDDADAHRWMGAGDPASWFEVVCVGVLVWNQDTGADDIQIDRTLGRCGTAMG